MKLVFTDTEDHPDMIAGVAALVAALTAETSDDCIYSIGPALDIVDMLAHSLSGMNTAGGGALLSSQSELSPRQVFVAQKLLDIVATSSDTKQQ